MAPSTTFHRFNLFRLPRCICRILNDEGKDEAAAADAGLFGRGGFRYDEKAAATSIYNAGKGSPSQFAAVTWRGLFSRKNRSRRRSLFCKSAQPGVAFYLDHLKEPFFLASSLIPADGNLFSVTDPYNASSRCPIRSTGRVTFELMPYADGGQTSHQLIGGRPLNKNNWRLEDLRRRFR